MKSRALEKRSQGPLRERSPYLLAFGVVTVMLYIAGFPVFLLFFIGMLGYFVWKVFRGEIHDETRKIFEFYLTASEILRESDRLWYGFEVQEVIAAGESIVRTMNVAPPLVYFCLGALFQKLGDHSSAVNYLSRIVGATAQREGNIVYPSRELTAYVRTLRKIERSPAEAPLTSTAVRTLERLRRNKAEKLLQMSLDEMTTEDKRKPAPVIEPTRRADNQVAKSNGNPDHEGSAAIEPAQESIPDRDVTDGEFRSDENGHRKTISEVLHDIYDQNVQ